MLGSLQGWNNQPINSRKADKAVLGSAGPCCTVPDGAESPGAGIHGIAPKLGVPEGLGCLYNALVLDNCR